MSDYIIFLGHLPSWMRYDLAKELSNKIETDNIDAKIPGYEVGEPVQADILTPDVFVKGAAVVLGGLIPFIYSKLKGMEVECKLEEDEQGKLKITVTGGDLNRVIKVQRQTRKLLGEKENDDCSKNRE